jgi:tetratricopeptide (TPR) repeat protein
VTCVTAHRPRRAGRLLALACAAFALLVSCARDPVRREYDRDLVLAERRLTKGDLAGARGDFQTLAATALRPEDRVDTSLRVIETLRREGRFDEAEEGAKALLAASKDLDVELRGKVALALARLVLDRGDEAQGQRLLERVIATFPSTTAARRAFLLLRGRLADSDPARLQAYCRQRWADDPKGPMADVFAYEGGRISFDKGTERDDVDAAAAFRLVVDGYTSATSGVWDDAVWDLSLIYHRRGQFHEEISVLDYFLSLRVKASAPGSYEIANYKFAWLRIARVYLEQLNQPREAAQWLSRFGDEFEYARVRDEALHFLALAWDRAGEPTRAADARRQLQAKFPDSKYLKPPQEGAP